MQRLPLVSAVAAVVLLVASGCTPVATIGPTSAPPSTAAPTPVATPTATPPQVTPTLSVEQQAAVEGVERWFGIYNEVLRGERNPNDLALGARGDVLEAAQRTFNQFGMANLTVEGEVAVTALVPSAPSRDERTTVAVDLCQDTTGWRVLDQDGNDTLELDAKAVRPLVATVEEWPDEGWFVTGLTKGEQTC